ncbi:MAG: tol-pal system protein YbgF [Magnetococcus sp. DMHC-6]
MSDEEVQNKVRGLSSSVAELTRGEESSRSQLAELTQRIASLESELNDLHGRIEQTQHNQDRMDTELLNLRSGVKTNAQSHPGLEVYSSQTGSSSTTTSVPSAADENTEVISSSSNQKKTTPPSAAVSDTRSAGGAGTFPATAKDSYDNAFTLLKNLQYDQSLQAFNDFLKRFPDDILADNSQYWVGEIHYVQGRFPESLVAFNQVLTKWPTSDKVPGSLLKIGFSFYELGDLPNARASLQRLIKEYPDSPAVAKAQQRLQIIDRKLEH